MEHVQHSLDVFTTRDARSPMSHTTGSYGCNIMPRFRTTPNLLGCVSDSPGENMNIAFGGVVLVAAPGSLNDSVAGNNNMASVT